MHSERGLVRQNPIQRTVRTAHLSVLMTAQNFQYTIQHRTVLIINPSYLQTTIMLRCCLSEEKGGIATATGYLIYVTVNCAGVRDAGHMLQ